jgi:tRNA-specific 2-thiouridylase
MSGGVDSSVAALLTARQGLDCVGSMMKLFHNEDIGQPRERACCTLEDAEDARAVARALDIPFYVFNFTGSFQEQVIARFVRAYQNGETPNPCIDCNRYLKFERLFQRAKELQKDYIVTGHYARIFYDEHAGRYQLKKGVDSSKDQSYVLYAMTQEQLRHTLFPLGELHKTQVRELALEQGFVNAKKHDSQDICFVPNGDYASFIEEYTGTTCPGGDFIDQQGKVLGRHRGIIHYTIGQRKGLGLALARPMYVGAIDVAENTVTLCEDSALYSSELDAVQFRWIALEGLEAPLRVQAKVRYKQQEQWATATQTAPDAVHLVFDQPQRAIAKGQAAVLYMGDVVLGGGTIR